MLVKTRLGEARICGQAIPGTTMQIVTVGTVVRAGKKSLTIPVGSVLVPYRFGRKKRHRRMAVHADAFSALLGRHGVAGYYGGVGRGKLCSAYDLWRRLTLQAERSDDALETENLGRLATAMRARLGETSRLVSRLDLWHSAVLLELDDHRAGLIKLERLLGGFAAGGKPPERKTLRGLSNSLRLAPFIDLRDGIAHFLGRTDAEPWEGRVLEAKQEAARELANEIGSYLRLIELQGIRFALKELERALGDAIGRVKFQPGEERWIVETANASIERLRVFVATETYTETKLKIIPILSDLGGVHSFMHLWKWKDALQAIKTARKQLKEIVGQL